MNLVKGSLQDELDHFFSTLNNEECDFRHVTKSAFCQARKKISHTAFIALNDKLIEEFYQSSTSPKWHGKRLVAIDGSTLRLPDRKVFSDHFGGQEKGVPLARVSFCVDLANDITRDTVVKPYCADEREMASAHLEKTLEDDLLIYDRGYHGFYTFALHRHRGRHFCMRMPVGVYNVISDFLDSGKVDDIITIAPSNSVKKQCEADGMDSTPVHLRALHIELSTGETEVLVTSLTQECYQADEFQALYHQRWGIEESIKHKKQPLEIENFSGLSIQSVKQDIHAKVLMKNIVAMAREIAQESVDQTGKKRKYRYKINATQALSKAKNVVIKAVFLSAKKACSLFEKFIDIIRQCIEPIRDGRSYSRNLKLYKRVYHPNIKRTR